MISLFLPAKQVVKLSRLPASHMVCNKNHLQDSLESKP